MKNTFEKVCAWLFGENKWQQEKKIKRLLIITAIASVLIILLMVVDSVGYAAGMGAIIILIWGWGFVRATAAVVGRIGVFFNNDMALFIISVILWLFLGLFGGMVSLILGIIRFIQIRRE